MSIWFGRIAVFIGAAAIFFALGACSYTREDAVVERASFSRWEVSSIPHEPSITFYSVGTSSRGLIRPEIDVYVGDIFAEVSPELLPGTALVSTWKKCYTRNVFRMSESCNLSRATLFVSSQAEADAWNRYFAELVVQREKEMGEKWAPKKIQPPPTFKKDLLNTCSDPC